MRRLYLQIYLAFVAVGLGALIVSGTVASLLVERESFGIADPFRAAAMLATVPDAELVEAVGRVAADLDADVAVWSPDGVVLASTGVVPFGRPGLIRRVAYVGIRFDLPDGRRVGAVQRRSDRLLGALTWLVVLGAALALGCYPIARRITRRLELAQEAVQRWGEGDLAARVPVLGRDEVAMVAQRFNVAAAEVERLFEAQRRMLASTSHELRSPLARLRVAIELAADGIAKEGWQHQAIADIEDLDAIVGDLLDVGRMQALDAPPHPEDLDLYELVRRKAARYPDVTVTGTPMPLYGDRRLLERLVGNLLDNALSHGAPPVRVTVGDGRLEVRDAGPGVSEAHADRIFEPFVRAPGESASDEGVGLGLYIVREIARSHGGDVRYEPGAGPVGGAFVVELAPPWRSADAR